MQWILNRLVAMCGAAEADDGYDDDTVSKTAKLPYTMSKIWTW
jgi:hypothetical protein